MKLIFVVGCLLAFINTACATDSNRQPAQAFDPYKDLTGTMNGTQQDQSQQQVDQAQPLPSNFITADVLLPKNNVVVNCILATGARLPISSGIQRKNLKVTRITAGGGIRYEVFNGPALVSSCDTIHISW